MKINLFFKSQNRIITYGIVWLISGVLFSQEIAWETVPDRTALEIVCDAPDIPVYVDGFFVGKSPITDLVDVMPGWHRVSFFPDVDRDNERQPKKQMLNDILRLGRQDVLVEKGAIVKVILQYRALGPDVETYQASIRSSRWMGFTMVAMVLSIFYWAFT